MNIIYIYLYFLLLLLTFEASECQLPVPCVSPPQFQAKYISYDSTRGTGSIQARLSYDSIYRRERILQQLNVQNKEDT